MVIFSKSSSISRTSLILTRRPFSLTCCFQIIKLNNRYSCKDVVVPAKNRAIVPTGLAIAAPHGTYARVAPRSGLAVKKFLDTGAGVVDEDYRGEVGVVLFNHSEEDFHVKAGDRVAQLILERIATPEVLEVDDLDETVRGAGGYGSTGVKS